MRSPFDVLPRVQPHSWSNEPYPGATGVVARVFDATDTTYKFYWFLSLLELVSRGNENDRLIVSIPEVGQEMIVHAWYTRRQFRLWFGHQDRLQLVVDHIGETSGLEPSAGPDQVRSAAAALPEREVRKVLGYVPYRFLTPWFRPVLRGLASDADVNLAIRLFAERSRRAAKPSPYCFDQVGSNASRILLDRPWLVFLRSNYILLRSFSLLSLARYFEVRNPGVPGIINKLERPNERSLASALAAWRAVLKVAPFPCIYSGRDLVTGFHLDHFIPWSFVTHDLFWNLLPVSPSANAKKSDSLPCLDRYLSPFISRHYQAARTLGKLLPAATSTERKSFHAVLQQYADLFEATEQDLLSYSPQEFEGRLQSEIKLQIERAKRLHFPADWTWETTMS